MQKNNRKINESCEKQVKMNELFVKIKCETNELCVNI